MKKSKIIFFLIICILVTVLTGCSKKEAEDIVGVEVEEENMFGLTGSEQMMYAEYAAGVLMKYNAGSNMRVLEGQQLINQEKKEQAAREQEERRQQLAAEYEANKKNNSNKNETSNSGGFGDSSGERGVSYISDMSVATGTDAFSIIYDGYEITDVYPNSGDDLFMAMDARAGKVFLVTKFSVTNNSGQTETFDMFSKQGKFRLNMNGERYKSQYTLLLDDLSMFKGDVEVGETINTVLIFEIPESAVANVNDMVLSITVDGETSSMQLLGGNMAMWTETAEEVGAIEEAEREEEGAVETEYESSMPEDAESDGEE